MRVTSLSRVSYISLSLGLALSLAGSIFPSVASAEPGPTVDPQTLAALKGVKPSDYPTASSIAVFERQAVVYQTDGQYSNTAHSLRIVVTNAAKDDESTASIAYSKGDEKLDILTAQVIKPDGTVTPVPPGAIQDTETSGDENIYDPNGRSVKITFANLAVGDAIDLEYRLTRLSPTRPNFFADEYAFQSLSPTVESTYTVDAPASMPLSSTLYNADRDAKIRASESKAGDRVHYRWTVANVPALVPEEGMDAATEIPMLVVSTDPSWENFSRWWADLTEPKMVATDEIKAKVAELTRDAKTDDAKIRALYDFVSSDVRYRGLGVGPRTGYTPRVASETLTSRWGVCRDVAILLATMLRVEGFEAHPVLTNMGEPVLSRIAYDGFNHAIVALPKAGGGWTYLDPTAKNNHDYLPGEEAEQDALVCTHKGETLARTPAAPPSGNSGHAIAQSLVGDDGSLTATVRIETTGMVDMVLRSVAATTSPNQQREIVESLIHGALPAAEVLDFQLSNALALGTPMSADLKIKVPGAAVKTGDYRLLRTLVTSGALGFIEAAAPRILGGLVTRKYVLDAHETFEWDEDETVTVPPGTTTLALPNDASASNAVSELISKCRQVDATTLSCHRSFKLKSRFIDPKQYTELRWVLSTVGQIAHQPVILGAAGKH